MSKRLLQPLLLGLGVLLIASATAHACSCRPTPAAEVLKRVDVAFQGRVLGTYRDGRRLFANIAVIRVLKGNVRTRVEVGTNASSAACGYRFRTGQVLLVGASYNQRQYS